MPLRGLVKGEIAHLGDYEAMSGTIFGPIPIMVATAHRSDAVSDQKQHTAAIQT
jgi:hypothetical protein